VRHGVLYFFCHRAGARQLNRLFKQHGDRATRNASGPFNDPYIRDVKGNSGASAERAMRLEGERRFQTNCGRCHQPPHKFPPRVMAAAIRHMRVRAMITDEDMRLILWYMTQ
jgi:mono/diheme cytochrome c family protein